MSIVMIAMKHDDRASIEMDGAEVVGYMPYTGILGGGFTVLKIDNETGKIVGWIPLQIEDGRFLEK